MNISVTLSPEVRLEQALIQAGTTDPATVTHLTVSGMLTDVDFGYIRKNMRETLHEFDMSSASVVVDLEQALENVRHEKRVAVKNQNFEIAAGFRDAEKVFEKLREVKAEWEQKQDLSKNCMIESDEKVTEVIATITDVPVQRIAQIDNPLIFKVINVNFPKNSEYFNQLVYNGAMMRYGNIGENIEKRLNFELQVINSKKWAEHFLLIRDMIDTIRAKGAIVAVNGSAPGSLVAYCLQITDIDPIAHELLFERFVNTESKIIPFSVCVDTEGEKDAVLFLVEKEIISKGGFIEKNLDGSINFRETDFDIFITGMKSLSIIRKIIEIHADNHVNIDIEHILTDDPVVFQKFANGETSGIFEFENGDMEELCLRLLKPSNIEDLAAIYSLNANSQRCRIEMISKLIDGKHGYEKIKYVIPELEKHLKNTYGITVYQEQVMSISRDLAGFSLCQSDELRKALGKKSVDPLNDFCEMFLEGCNANGYDKNKVVEIWNTWISHGTYETLFFNKSHAISVALLEYRMAWLKTYYPIIGVLS